VPENIQFSISCRFFTQLNCTVKLREYGALKRRYAACYVLRRLIFEILYLLRADDF